MAMCKLLFYNICSTVAYGNGDMLAEVCTQILILVVTALIGIMFVLLRWLFVSRVRMCLLLKALMRTTDIQKSLIGYSELENGVWGLQVPIKCAKTQQTDCVGNLFLLPTYYV
jgi:hypothetical protein